MAAQCSKLAPRPPSVGQVTPLFFPLRLRPPEATITPRIEPGGLGDHGKAIAGQGT